MGKIYLTKREQQYQKNLIAIRATVDKLVHEVGFEKMSIREICSGVGMSTGNFYNYFSSKDDLLFDRYRRMNIFFKNLYDEKLSKLDSISALKMLLDKRNIFVSSRVTEIQRPYHKARMDNNSSWTAKEPDMFEYVIKKIISTGVEKKEISLVYSEKEIFDFLSCISDGITKRECISEGHFIKDNTISKLYSDWIDSLANKSSSP